MITTLEYIYIYIVSQAVADEYNRLKDLKRVRKKIIDGDFLLSISMSLIDPYGLNQSFHSFVCQSLKPISFL